MMSSLSVNARDDCLPSEGVCIVEMIENSKETMNVHHKNQLRILEWICLLFLPISRLDFPSQIPDLYCFD